MTSPPPTPPIVDSTTTTTTTKLSSPIPLSWLRHLSSASVETHHRLGVPT
eukprot:CAMPEP_0194750400 /NCGR_PEP_ID=MMETSP0323_2-20130528/4461_1 /TAXON_ID=2866 ORGANISM="Crypthecodinium cohnii, Strain Seligo" /NCGR_SAMPLE_ID=MMETSP0323_2 /ASSEMBLY_ACC=CAM_ASM_000346 /LENGTH=49 /DNA_ID= /DNA_START= /DNA_END= /DNA_ORIENTATION=